MYKKPFSDAFLLCVRELTAENKPGAEIYLHVVPRTKSEALSSLPRSSHKAANMMVEWAAPYSSFRPSLQTKSSKTFGLATACETVMETAMAFAAATLGVMTATTGAT